MAINRICRYVRLFAFLVLAFFIVMSVHEDAFAEYDPIVITPVIVPSSVLYYSGSQEICLELSGGDGEYYSQLYVYQFINGEWETTKWPKELVNSDLMDVSTSVKEDASKVQFKIIITDSSQNSAEWNSGECFITKLGFDFNMDEINLVAGQAVYMKYSGVGSIPFISSSDYGIVESSYNGSSDENGFVCELYIIARKGGTAYVTIKNDNFDLLARIKVNVFTSDNIEAFELPADLLKIESQAFAGTNAPYIRIPNGVIEIADDAIPKTSTLLVHEGSNIIEWAIDQGYQLIVE